MWSRSRTRIWSHSPSARRNFSTSSRNVARSLSFNGLSGAESGAHLHGPAGPTANGPLIATLPDGHPVNFPITLTVAQANALDMALRSARERNGHKRACI